MSETERSASMGKSFTFELLERLGTISTKNGISREVNIVSWNGRPAKIDIRGWDDDHENPTKGLSLTEDEAQALYEILKGRFGDESIKG